jgi:flagellar protein FliO/FliZ
MEMSWAILKMILVLGTILLVLFLLAKLMKKNRMMTGGSSGDSGIRVLATQYLAPQKYLSLVEMGGEILALGISEAQINLLTKIENREFIERMLNRTAPKQEAPFPLQYFQPFFMKPKGFKGGLWRRVYGK